MVAAVARRRGCGPPLGCFQKSVDACAQRLTIPSCFRRPDVGKQRDSHVVGGFGHRDDYLLPVGNVPGMHRRSARPLETRRILGGAMVNGCGGGYTRLDPARWYRTRPNAK